MTIIAFALAKHVVCAVQSIENTENTKVIREPRKIRAFVLLEIIYNVALGLSTRLSFRKK